MLVMILTLDMLNAVWFLVQLSSVNAKLLFPHSPVLIPIFPIISPPLLPAITGVNV